MVSQFAAKYPIKYRSTPDDKNFPACNVNRAKVEPLGSEETKDLIY